MRFLGSALCACAPSVPCGCAAAALQSRCARPARALLGFSFTPLKRRRSAIGMEAAECRVLTRRSAAGAKGEDCCFVFCRCLAGCAACSCAALGCGSSLVAASLDSPLPLETPPLRYGAVAAGAGRCAAGAGMIAALRRISAVVWEATGAGRYAAGAGSISALRRISAVVLEAAGGWPLRGGRGVDIGFAADKRRCLGGGEG